MPTSLDADRIRAAHGLILERLEAAVVMRWGALPTGLRRDLFEHATSLADREQADDLEGQVARFLHQSLG